MSNVTIKAVAKDANVSIATVSRVLNKNYTVSPELEKRVLASIEKLNYYPNSIARSLKYDNTLSIGLIVSDISNSFFFILARAVEDVIMRQNYNLIVCSTDNQRDKELSHIQLLVGKKVDGLIINTTGKNDALVTSVSQDIPVVLCGRRVEAPGFRGDFVDSDNETGSYDLTRYILSMGHRRIAVINGQSYVSSAQERLSGFRRAMAAAGLRVDADYPYLFDGDFNDPRSGFAGAARLMSLPTPPTAIITMNNELCTGAMRYCRTSGVRIPEDVSLCSYGMVQNLDLLYVQPSYVTMDPFTLGRRIAENMLERIACKNEIVSREVLYSAQLVEGNGVRKL